MKLSTNLRFYKRAMGRRATKFYSCLRLKSRRFAKRAIAATTGLELTENANEKPATMLDLFGLIISTDVYSASARFGVPADVKKPKANKAPQKRKKKRGKKKRAHRKVGLQYKIDLRVRSTDRVVSYRPKDNADHRLLNAETASWSNAGLVALHQTLLFQSICNAKRTDELEYDTGAEIWMWINRPFANEPFSFIRCCELSSVDPDVIRASLRKLLRDNSTKVDLLRKSILAAESGDQDAIAWCLSDAAGAYSFEDTCRAIGFDPKDARRELRIPAFLPDAAAAAA